VDDSWKNRSPDPFRKIRSLPVRAITVRPAVTVVVRWQSRLEKQLVGTPAKPPPETNALRP
jgi:hypothetical protein